MSISTSTDFIIHSPVKLAWKTEYQGDSADLLARFLKYEQNRHLTGLGNQIPICQSSGMGKSRLIDEVAKQIFTIPMCLSNVDGTSEHTCFLYLNYTNAVI